MSHEYSYNARGAKYAYAMAFLFFVPGSLLAILSRFQPALLPRSIVEFIFSIAILPLEKQLIAAFYDQSAPVGHARIDPEIINSLGIFGQQTFVVALLCFILILAIYVLKARAGALYAQPTLGFIPVLLVVVIVSAVMRVFFAYLLVANADSIPSNLPTQLPWIIS
jgi:glucan phosphoethanolaminetransferase (alkaline phosphatase superfamily)